MNFNGFIYLVQKIWSLLFKQVFRAGVAIVFSLIIQKVQSQNENTLKGEVNYDYLDSKHVPPQPLKESMYFIDDLKAPLWVSHPWKKSSADMGEADLSAGVTLRAGFDDPQERLETAYKDLIEFLGAGNLKVEEGKYLIETRHISGLEEEVFILEVGLHSCRLLASEPEGIRRGIFYLEDQMLKRRGPYLKVGTVNHSPAVKRRIIRGYFSPTKRPGSLPRVQNQPIVVDELMNEIDYYPGNYLNRLAHQGVNGLWLSVSGTNSEGKMVGFGDLVATSSTPGEGVDGKQRLEKLRTVVEKCLRYGIRTYIFTIEPCVRLEKGNPLFKQYKESEVIGDEQVRNLCGSSDAGQKYLYEATNKIFKAVPDLGGIINISHGERYTTCLSSLSATGQGQINCPRCSKMPPWEILYKSLSAMERGMHDAAPAAELISWLYMPQPQAQSPVSVDTLAGWVYTLPAHTPPGVILQFNFTSGVEKSVNGKKLIGGDYWLMPAGPSPRFEQIAHLAGKNGTPTSAKIQTAASHEITTVPYVPAPSALYRKFAAMRGLGVSHTMLSWYFGNAPGLMVKAIDLLSYDTLTSEHNFLHELASVYWKKADVPKVVQAWKHFEEGYANYPLTNLFQYYGPMHDGPVWPLLLKPVDAPLSPTWLLGSTQTTKLWPPSGDRIGDAFTNLLSPEEVLSLCAKMTASWDSGVAILNEIEPDYSQEPDRLLDIGVAKAIGIQFRSGYNILRFYFLREKMLRMKGIERLKTLDELRAIVYEELELDAELLLLSRRDSRLGFHPEAEGYKYYPAKIQWRMEQLRRLLSADFPEVEGRIRKDEGLFPEYTGEKPTGLMARSIYSNDKTNRDRSFNTRISSGISWLPLNSGQINKAFQWASDHDIQNLNFFIREVNTSVGFPSQVSRIVIRIQPRRLWPVQRFDFNTKDIRSDEGMQIVKLKDRSMILIKIPWKNMGVNTDSKRIRVDVQIVLKDGKTGGWCTLQPVTSRLMYGTDNPNDLGWLLLER